MNTFLPVVEELPEGHPVKVYYEEGALIQVILNELKKVSPADEFQKYFNIFNELTNIEKRFARKENQLFPYLEKHGWEGPSQGMWSFHDNLRDIIRLLKKQNEEKDIEKIEQNLPFLIDGIERLMGIEDMRLFPNAMQLLTKEDWKEFYEGDEEIGWMLPNKPTPYPENEEEYFKYIEKIEKIRVEKQLKPSEYWYLKSLGAFRYAVHGIEHAFIKTVPIFYIEDLAGISKPDGEIIIYEAVPGGVGYSKTMYSKFFDILKASYSLLKKCKCLCKSVLTFKFALKSNCLVR